MPRLSKSLPKYRKHRGSGQAVVTLCGIDHYLGPHGTKASHVEYDRLIAEWLVTSRQPVGLSDSKLTVNELLARYWQFAQGHYVKNGKPTTELEGIKVTLRAVRELYGKVPATEFGPLAIKAVRLRAINAGLTRSGANRTVARIKRVFKWGVSEQLVPAEIFQALATVVGSNRHVPSGRFARPVLSKPS